MGSFYRDTIVGDVVKIGDRDSDIGIKTADSAPTDGGSGTGAGELDKGSLIIAKDTGTLYENKGTKASPTWNAVGEISETEISNGAVTEDKIANNVVNEDHLTTSVAGEGLSGGDGDALAVTISEDTIVEPVDADLVLGSADAEVTFTADNAGTAAHDYSVEIVDPGGNDEELNISDSGGAIEISAATDGGGVITSSANDVVSAFNTHADTYNIPITASVKSGTGADPVSAEGPSSLSGGVDGTVGYKGQLLFDANFIYVSTDDSTVSVGNWKKATLNSIS